jgi:threonine/homoserine efflux transporter RhtA
MIVRYVIAWFPMVVVGIINGVIREQWYGNYLSELRAHQVSTVTGAVLFGLYIWVISRIWQLESGVQSLSVGFIWLAMTVCFEFFFEHYVAGHPWSRLFHDYNILAGRILGLLLLWITVAPYVFCRLQQ